MTENTTIMNESINTTATNSTGYWRPFGQGEFPDIAGWLLELETLVVDMLISWGLDPIHVFFQIGIGATIVISIYYLFVKTTSSSSKIFSLLAYIAVIFIILILLEVI